MEMTTLKCEVTEMGKRSFCILDDETPEIKRVKRRRREPTRAVLGFDAKKGHNQQVVDQSTTTSVAKRSSKFRGVSKHRWTGRYEAHLWDKASWNVTQKKKGKQVYLGAYDEEECAARAYDLAALKYWGPTTFTNFPIADYETEINIMQKLTKEEYLANLRRKSSGFSRGVSKYRGVARHHHNGRWEARIGRVFGNKYLYLGTYSTQEEAARAYDIAAIEYRGVNAVTNFDLNTYIKWLRPEDDTNIPPNDPEEMVTPQVFPSSYNSSLNDGPELMFHTSQFTPSIMGSPRKTEASTCAISSSPTALGVLLRSSIFKELVEKNSSASDNEVEGDDTRHEITGTPYEYGNILYEEITGTPYVCSNDDSILNIHNIENQNPYYDQTRQFLWDVC